MPGIAEDNMERFEVTYEFDEAAAKGGAVLERILQRLLDEDEHGDAV